MIHMCSESAGWLSGNGSTIDVLQYNTACGQGLTDWLLLLNVLRRTLAAQQNSSPFAPYVSTLLHLASSEISEDISMLSCSLSGVDDKPAPYNHYTVLSMQANSRNIHTVRTHMPCHCHACTSGEPHWDVGL